MLVAGGCNHAADGATGRREPTVMTSVPSAAGLIHLGMDTSVNEIVVAVLPAGEAVRALVRAGGDLLDDRKRMQQRLNAMLLRHGRVWRGGKKWSYAHRAWVDRQVFDEPALAEAFALYRGGLEAREAELAAAEARLGAWAGRDPLAGPVARLGAYRGIAQLTGLTLAAEVVDWRRFASARAFMGFAGLT